MLLKTLFILGDIGFYNMNLLNLINTIRSQIKPNDAIVILGDNFYPMGVRNNYDAQWYKYKSIFKNINSPIYSILGNHDYLQNPKSQIKNDNWIMNDWYFKKEYDNIDLYFLDTVQFNIGWVDLDKIESIHNSSEDQLIKSQINWLNKELKKNNKKKLVFGHYPIITNGVYKNRLNKLYDLLIDTFKNNNVNIYISGHEHNIQYIKKDINDFEFNQIIIGSSAEFRDEINYCVNNDMYDNTDNFFGKINIYDKYYNLQFINSKNKTVYEYNIKN